MGLFRYIGAQFLALLTEIGQVSVLGIQSLYWGVRPPVRFRQILKQFEFVGVQSTFIILLTSLFSGAVFSLQGSYAFRLFDAETMVGPAVMLSLTRELGPVLTGLLVTGRVGSAMAAELGTMRVTEQIDALDVIAVNPIQYLVVPRLIALVIMMPMLVTLFDFVGGVGSYLVSTHLLEVPPATFLEDTLYYVDFDDYYIGLIKASFFGLVMGLISCHRGFYVTGGAEGVGRATTQAVVISSVVILVSDYFLTALLF